MKAVKRYFDIVADDDKTLYNRDDCEFENKDNCDCDVCMQKKKEFDRAMLEDWHKAETVGPHTPEWWKKPESN